VTLTRKAFARKTSGRLLPRYVLLANDFREKVFRENIFRANIFWVNVWVIRLHYLYISNYVLHKCSGYKKTDFGDIYSIFILNASGAVKSFYGPCNLEVGRCFILFPILFGAVRGRFEL
jgi:hypothetical protein